TNATSGSIAGSSFGVKASGPFELSNDGTISSSASSGIGVYVTGSAAIIRNSSPGSTIEGNIAGISLVAGGTVTNGGTITGQAGKAIVFGGTAPSRLVAEAGAVFNGTVIGSAGAKNTLELASSISTGTIGGIGTSFLNFGTV